jgi:plastocyanin
MKTKKIKNIEPILDQNYSTKKTPRKGLAWTLVILLIMVVILSISYISFVTPSTSFIVPNISFVTGPSIANTGDSVPISWYVYSGKGTTSNVQVVYGLSSVLDPQTINDYQLASDNVCSGGCSIPDFMSTNLEFNDPRVYFYRIHATVNGKDFWSSEQSITINQPISQPTKTPSSTTYNIDMTGYNFNPPILNINKGDTVVWTNDDSSIHSVTSSSDGIFNSGNMYLGSTFNYTFNQSGSYDYHSEFDDGMAGLIIVT